MRNLSLLILLTTVVSSQAFGQQLYKWVDEWGVTHYSQAAPKNVSEHVTFDFPDSYAVANPDQDYYSIQNQLKRMQARKRAQKKFNQSIRAAKKQKTAIKPPVHVDRSPPQRYYLPAYQPRYYPLHPYQPYRPPELCCSESGQSKAEKPPARITQKGKPGQSSSSFTASR